MENLNILSKAKQENISSQVKKKKISFISAIFIVIGSCIGSGIFFKAKSVLENSWYSLPLAIFSWVISSISIICMSLSLLEITKKEANNLSLIGWVKNFSNKFFYKTCKNFMFYIYTPLTFFFMPLYVLMALQDSLLSFGISNNFNTANDWAIWGSIGLLISLFFIFTSGISSKIGNFQNWIIILVKFFPLVIAVVLGFIIANQNQKLNTNPIIIAPDKTNFINTEFTKLSPGIGLFISFSAIFFAYDGFYYSSGIQSEMKDPKKTPTALIIGLIVTTIIYLLIAISMSIAYPKGGSVLSFQDFLNEKKLGWIGGVTNLLISIGILGIINSFAMWSTRFTENLIKLYELPLSHKLINKLNDQKPIVGSIYIAVVSILVYILFTIIGGLGYIATSSYLENNSSYYDGANYYSMAKLYGFADLMSNWTSIFAFSYIVVVIICRLMTRNKKDLDIPKFKYYTLTSIVSSIIVFFGLFFQTIAPFVDVFLLINIKNPPIDVSVSRIMLVVVLIIFVFFSTFPSIFDYDSKFSKKIYKSHIS